MRKLFVSSGCCAVAIAVAVAVLQSLPRSDAHAATGPDTRSFVLRAPAIGADSANGFGLTAWDLDPTFADGQLAYIRDAVRAAFRQANSDFGQVDTDFAVVAYGDPAVLSSKRAAWEHVPVASIGDRYACDFCAETVYGVMFVHVSSGWTNDLAFPGQIGRQTIAHEYFHILQGHAIGNSRLDRSADPARVPSAGPVWLIEGSAHWWGWRAAINDLGVSARTLLGRERLALSLDQTALELMESPNGFSASRQSYHIGLLAVDLLMGTRPRAALLNYFEEIGAGQSWQDAFSHAFNMTIAAFYQQFADYRLHLGAPQG